MSNILWLSDSPLTNTGYATISRNICNGLSDEHKIYFEGHNYLGQDIPRGLKLADGFEFKFELLGCGREAYCKDVTMNRIFKYKADAHIVLLDTFMLYPWMLNENYYPAKSIFYFPSDGGGGMPNGCENILRHVNMPIAMSKFGQKQVKDFYNIDALYIPHAVDEVNYRPLSSMEKEAVRREYEVLFISGQKMKGFLIDKFVVGTVARNQGRKMLDRTLKAFAEFCKDKPDAVMLFHSDLYDGAAVFDMRELIKRYNIENRVCFSDIRAFDNFDYKDMNKVYNVMDVFFLSTSGEGFGVPTIEAMSCGVPCAVTDYTTTPELLVQDGLCGIPIRLAGCEDISMTDMWLNEGKSLKEIDLALSNATLTGSWSVERGLMSIPHAVFVLNKYYSDPLLRASHGLSGREKVIKYYTWDVNIKLWKEAIKRLLQ